MFRTNRIFADFDNLSVGAFYVAKCSYLFVSQRGTDLHGCGNWTMPCRSVRYAVHVSNDGDEIYVDYAQGRPYIECENMTQSSSCIELKKSVSFFGVNGKAEIACKNTSCNLFTIKSSGFVITHVQFVNLIISTSKIAAKLDSGARTELIFNDTLVRYNLIGLYSDRATECNVKIHNSSFEHNPNWGIRLKCRNVTTRIISTTFKQSLVSIGNVANTPTGSQENKILIKDTVFDGGYTGRYEDMLAIQPFAAKLNITVIGSKFKNYVTADLSHAAFSAFAIYDRSGICTVTCIYLKGLLVENNYNNSPALSIIAVHMNYTLFLVVIRDCVFKNNSAALSLTIRSYGRFFTPLPTSHVQNSTFVDNFYDSDQPQSAAAISFTHSKYRVEGCRFLDNRAGPNPYAAVVTITAKALVTFLDCYFENRQTSVQSNQVFASGDRQVYFRRNNAFNMVALKKGQSVLVRITTSLSSGIIFKKDFKILCPQGYELNAQRQCARVLKLYVCSYINVQCEQCPTKTYTLERGEYVYNDSNHIQCEPCPRGGQCDNGLVRAKSNFWGYKTKLGVTFVQCPPGYCCESDACVSYNSCHGNRSGTLCGECPEGMSESLFSTHCISNAKCSKKYSIFGTTMLFVLYLLFFLFRKEITKFFQSLLHRRRVSVSGGNEDGENTTTQSNSSKDGGIIKIIFYYYQVCFLLRGSVGSRKQSEFMNTLESSVSRLLNMVIVQLPSFNCPLENLRAVRKAVLLHSVGYCLLGLLGLLYLVSKLFLLVRRLRRGRDRRIVLQSVTRSCNQATSTKLSFSDRIASAFTYISLLMYASSAQLCLSLLHCVPVGDSQVLFLDGNIKCYQPFQYFLLAYTISSILPFCLVPVLGSYLLKMARIGVKQFCAGCIFPLPFCCFWLYLLLRDCRWGNGNINGRATFEEIDNEREGESHFGEGNSSATDTSEANSQRSSEKAILGVLLGPFRPHKSFMCFPSSSIPWEGFLIFRRLVLIIVLTFVYDIQLRLIQALTLCVAILMIQMFVNPFQKKRDNILESFSLGTHVVLCGFTLIKALYYGENFTLLSNSSSVLNVIENVLVIAPMSVIVLFVLVSVVIKLVSKLLLLLYRILHFLARLCYLKCSE